MPSELRHLQEAVDFLYPTLEDNHKVTLTELYEIFVKAELLRRDEYKCGCKTCKGE